MRKKAKIRHPQKWRTYLPGDCIDVPIREAIRKQWAGIGTLTSWPYNSINYLKKKIADGFYIYIQFSLTPCFIFFNYLKKSVILAHKIRTPNSIKVIAELA